MLRCKDCSKLKVASNDRSCRTTFQIGRWLLKACGLNYMDCGLCEFFCDLAFIPRASPLHERTEGIALYMLDSNVSNVFSWDTLRGSGDGE